MTQETGSGSDPRQRAYAAGARITRERLAREAPLDAEALAAVEESDIVVVPGCYDHVERVLGALDLPFMAVEGPDLGRLALRPEQLLVINCPGTLDARGLARVGDFVTRGGSLFTTDWALRHVLEPAFPGFVAHNGVATADDVVRIEVRDRDNPFLRGVLDSGDDPQWWLEGSSYPIRILDPARVDVLITSPELADKYGEAPVAVLFRVGEGEVFHMVSHYYLQRTELRSARHAAPAAEYVAWNGVELDEHLACATSDLSAGDLESAQTSARFLANVVATKRRSASPARP